MFNNTHSIEKKAENLVMDTEESAKEVGRDVRKSAKNIASKSKSEYEDREAQATELIAAIKSFLNDYSNEHNLGSKQEILAKAIAAKDAIALQIESATKECKATAEKTVHEHPLGTVAAAAGAGMLLGYFLNKK